MPVSPFRRAADEGLTEPTGHVSGPTGGKKKRKRRQRIRERYAKAREDAQLAGVIPTTPEGALRPERVRPSADPALPDVVRQGLREGWATPDAAKPDIVASLLRPLYEEMTVLDKDGCAVQIKPGPKTVVELARTIALLDKQQYERDHPEAAGRARGGVNLTAVSVESNVIAVQVLRRMFEDGIGRGETALPPPIEPCPPGHSRFDGEVEVGAASTED